MLAQRNFLALELGAESGRAIAGTIADCRLSLALKYRLTLGRLGELLGRRLAPSHIIGGGMRNRLLNQLAADCTGRAVAAGPAEAIAIGNILMQAITLGHLVLLAEARALVRRSFDVEVYFPGRPEVWDLAFAKLLSLSNMELP